MEMTAFEILLLSEVTLLHFCTMKPKRGGHLRPPLFAPQRESELPFQPYG